MITVECNEIVNLKDYTEAQDLAAATGKMQDTFVTRNAYIYQIHEPSAALAHLDPEVQRDVICYRDKSKWEVLDYGKGPDCPTVVDFAAMVRGELELSCSCIAGRTRQLYRHLATGMEMLVTFDYEVDGSHGVCHRRAAWKEEEMDYPAWMPPRFRNHRVVALQPFSGSPINERHQEAIIDQLDEIVYNLISGNQRSWLLVGPPGSSKTTLISAALTDLHTIRWAEMNEEHPYREPRSRTPYLDSLDRHPKPKIKHTLEDFICMWRVKVPDWLKEIHAYDTRDFDSFEIKEPSITVETIRALSEKANVPPVIWLEEIDKFAPTNNRRNYLFRLIDAVYEMGGTIVTSANLTPDELEEHLGPAIYRRLAGTNESEDEEQVYTVMDFHAITKASKKTKTNSAKGAGRLAQVG